MNISHKFIAMFNVLNIYKFFRNVRSFFFIKIYKLILNPSFIFVYNFCDNKTPITITCSCVHSIKFNVCNYIA